MRSANARASLQLAREVQQLWLLSCQAVSVRGADATLDEAIARSVGIVIAAHRTTERRAPLTRLRNRVVAVSTLLSDALAEAPAATRVSVMRPLCAAPGMTLSHWDLPPSERPYPYRLAEQEAVLVLDGRPTLLAQHERRELCEGELVGFGAGQSSGHELVNRTSQTVHFLSFGGVSKLAA
jgi:hypothetical protein